MYFNIFNFNCLTQGQSFKKEKTKSTLILIHIQCIVCNTKRKASGGKERKKMKNYFCKNVDSDDYTLQSQSSFFLVYIKKRKRKKKWLHIGCNFLPKTFQPHIVVYSLCTSNKKLNMYSTTKMSFFLFEISSLLVFFYLDLLYI